VLGEVSTTLTIEGIDPETLTRLESEASRPGVAPSDLARAVLEPSFGASPPIHHDLDGLGLLDNGWTSDHLRKSLRRAMEGGTSKVRRAGIRANFTPTQGRYLAFIHAYIGLHGYPPAESEIAAAMCVSPPSINQMVKTLEKKGLILRHPGQPRSLQILIPDDEIPPWNNRNQAKNPVRPRKTHCRGSARSGGAASESLRRVGLPDGWPCQQEVFEQGD